MFSFMRHALAIVDSDAASLRALHALLGPLNADMLTFDAANKFMARLVEGTLPTLACVIVDLALADETGVQLLKQIRQRNADVPVVMIANEADVATAVDAMRQGATDFIEKSQMDVALPRRVAQFIRDREH